MMKPIGNKYKITKDKDGWFRIYKKRLFWWEYQDCQNSYERAKQVISNLEFVQYITTLTSKDKEIIEDE